METKTVTIPGISCGHCTNTIETEVAEIYGVSTVKADKDSKKVTIEWMDPATWDKILATLNEINFPPADSPELPNGAAT